MKQNTTLEKLLFAALVSAIMGVNAAFGSGFGLYEASTKSYAMGGAVLGRAVDASANFFNPATLTDLTNITVTAGVMTEHPRGRMKVDGVSGYKKMDPGCFWLPHFHAAIPLPWDFAFGLGVMPEYGLGSKYSSDWPLNFNSTETTIQSVTINPNLAWKYGDFSVGGGMRFLWFDFEQFSLPYAANLYGSDYRFRNRLKGDNDMKDYGYQVGFKYDVREDLSVGLTYKSMTRVHVKGKSTNRLATPGSITAINDQLRASALANSGPAKTTLDLPQSITLGCNWDITDDWHLGTAIAWTEWSSVGTLNFHLPKNGQKYGQTKKIKLDWEDTWRFAIAPSWDFAEDWTWIASYIFETDCCGSQDSTMLPPSNRHMISTGFVWECIKNLELALTYGIILMDGNDSDCTRAAYTGNSTPIKYEYSAHRALSHAAGFSITYRF